MNIAQSLDFTAVVLRIWVGGYFLFYGLNGFFGWVAIPRNSQAFEAFIIRLSATPGLMSLVKLIEIVTGGGIAAGIYPGACVLVLSPIVATIVVSHLCLNFQLGWRVSLVAGVPFFLLAFIL